MRYLVDTNVLLRWSHGDSEDHSLCTGTIDGLLADGHDVCICAQVLIEFRVVATRPWNVNGLGLTPADVKARTKDLRRMFTCLPEPPDIADRWEAVADRFSVIGRQAHDARIAALMLAHGVTHMLTLNPADFARYSDITAVTPQEIV